MDRAGPVLQEAAAGSGETRLDLGGDGQGDFLRRLGADVETAWRVSAL
jgi:hypothetical protein